MESPIKKLLSQTAIYGFTVILGRALNFLLVPLYVYVFEAPKDYGVVSILYAWVAFLVVLLPLGLETAFFKFFSDNPEKKQQIFQNSFLSVASFNGIFLLLLLIFSQQIANWILLPEHPIYIILLGLIVCIDATSAIPLAKLRIENRAKKFASVQLTSILTNITLNLVLLLFFFDKNSPHMGVLFILIANLASSLIKPFMVLNEFRGIEFKIDRALVKKMLIYSTPLVIAGFAGIINETIDRILLQQMLYDTQLAKTGLKEASLNFAESQVGIYSACYKLAMLVTIFLQAFRYAAEPFFFSNSQNTNRNKLYIKVMNYLIATLCVVFLVVTLNIDIFKYFIPNTAYWVGLDVVPILLLANIFLGIYINQSIWYKLSGQTKFGAYIAIGGAITTILINLIFIPTYGYMASAWATMIVYGLQMLASYYLGQKYYPIKYNINKFLLYFGLTLVLFLSVRQINIESEGMQFFIYNLFILFFIGIVVMIERVGTKKAIH